MVLSAWLIAQSLKSHSVNVENAPQEQNATNETQNRYEFIPITNDYFFIFDKHNGDTWRKVGSQDWEKRKSIQDLSK